MAAPAPSTLDILTAAARDLGIIGLADTQPPAEETAVLLDKFNDVCEERNMRRRNAYFMRSESFTFGTSRQSYTIGRAADSPNFSVSAGGAPVRIEFAQLVLTDVTPNVQLTMGVINVEQYTNIAVPDLSSQFPLVLYYYRTSPNGTIKLYPTYPTLTSYQLNLTWWNQLDTVAIADIQTALVLPQGYKRALTASVAVASWSMFPKRTALEHLEKTERRAWGECTSSNVSPPKISTTDGIGSTGSVWDWRTGMWQ